MSLPQTPVGQPFRNTMQWHSGNPSQEEEAEEGLSIARVLRDFISGQPIYNSIHAEGIMGQMAEGMTYLPYTGSLELFGLRYFPDGTITPVNAGSNRTGLVVSPEFQAQFEFADAPPSTEKLPFGSYVVPFFLQGSVSGPLWRGVVPYSISVQGIPSGASHSVKVSFFGKDGWTEQNGASGVIDGSGLVVAEFELIVNGAPYDKLIVTIDTEAELIHDGGEIRTDVEPGDDFYQKAVVGTCATFYGVLYGPDITQPMVDVPNHVTRYQRMSWARQGAVSAAL